MSLFRMSLAGAILILAVVVIRAIAIHKLPKKAFLAFWWITVIRLLLPVSFPAVSNIFTLTNKSAPVLDAVEKGISDLTAVILTNQQTVTENPSVQVSHGSTQTLSVLFLIWIIGALFSAGIFLVSYLRCRCEFKTSLPVQNDFVKEWLSDHPLRRKMEIRSLTGISTPLTYGIIHPIILMPKSTVWENEHQLQYMLYHEYVHIRRFDTVSKLIITATVCLHWFNPMVWVLFVLFNRDIELACDERVIHHFGGNDRAAYARTLISMEERRHNFTPFYNYFAKNAIEERIESIMKLKKRSTFTLAMALMLVTVGTATAFAANADSEDIISWDLNSNSLSSDPTDIITVVANTDGGIFFSAASLDINTDSTDEIAVVEGTGSDTFFSAVSSDIITDSANALTINDTIAIFPKHSKKTSIAAQSTIPYRVGFGDDKTYFEKGTNIEFIIECADGTIPLEISLSSADGPEIFESYRMESAEQTNITFTIPKDGDYLILVKNLSPSRTQEYAHVIAIS